MSIKLVREKLTEQKKVSYIESYDTQSHIES